MPEAVIVATARSPIGRAFKGSMTSIRPDDLTVQLVSAALAKVPGGSVSSSELEKEHGKLVWSFDIAQTGSKNITEVQVDAKTGKVVSTKTETPDKERKEAMAEKK